MLIKMCGRIIDTRLEYSTKPALNFAQIALEKEKAEQKKEQKEALSLEYSEEYLSIKALKSTQDAQQSTAAEEMIGSKHSRKTSHELEVSYSKLDLKLDILV